MDGENASRYSRASVCLRAAQSKTGALPHGRSDFSEEDGMGMFDDAMKNAVPGGNLATPIAVAVGALILGRFFGGSSAPAPAPTPTPSTTTPVPTDVPPGSLLGGLGDLIGKLTAGGAGPQVNSWVGQGANQPIQPGTLGSALGPNTLNDLSART